MPDKTLSYYRTQWFKEVPGYDHLESVVREIIRKAPHVDDSAVTRNNGVVIELRHKQVAAETPVLLFCVSHKPGAEGSLVPAAAPKAAGPLETMAPPKNKNFVEGSVAALITGNHCLLCTAGLSQAALRYYLFMMIKEKGLPEEARRFNLAPVANRDKISEIIETGVAAVGLSATLDSLLHAGEDAPVLSLSEKAKRTVSEAVTTILGKDFDLKTLMKEDLSNINTKLVISLKKRGHGVIDQESFDEAAKQVAEEEEPGVYIRLRSGTIIDADKMKLTRRVDIDNHGSTLDYKAAWKELITFYGELKKDKLIE